MSAVERASSPTVAVWDGRRQAREKMMQMAQMGLHVFNPAWQQVQDSGRVASRYSATFTETTLTILGGGESMTFPVQTCTRVGDVRAAIAQTCMVQPEEIAFLVKQGCNHRKMHDSEEIARKVVVKGIPAFKPTVHEWPHPLCVIGAGYNGIKTCIQYLKDRKSKLDIVCFDRNSKVGGYCWITAANKHSKLQTEMGSFHVWWGPEYGNRDECGGFPVDWEFWPRKERVLEHFELAAKEYGMLPHCRFNTNVSAIDIVGEKNSHDRYYDLTVTPVDGGEQFNCSCSVMYNYPGSMTKNRIIEYPGEEDFGGHIGYGMNDEMPYDHLKGSNVAILGNGAFAVENVRTAIEYGAKKCFLVTRRKNLPSPRVPCWFVHQGPLPSPGRLVLDMFKPMYDITPSMGDPWSYWGVHAPSDRRSATIIQNSRFGIGDVTFLALIWGKMEYVETSLKRVSHHTLHLNNGEKLQDIQVIVKSLGLLGDFAVDRLHKMKELKGMWIEGDWRRIISIDPLGMNAANFTTFSTGIGTSGQVLQNKYLHEYPKEYYKMEAQGLLQALPKQKADEALERPAYVTDVKYQMSASIIIDSMCPRAQDLQAGFPAYKYELYHRAHPLDKFLKVCSDEWDKYQEAWRAQGDEHEHVPYPYTREIVTAFFDDWNRSVGAASGFLISPDGPELKDKAEGPGEKQGADEKMLQAVEAHINVQHLEYWSKEGPKRNAMFVQNMTPQTF